MTDQTKEIEAKFILPCSIDVFQSRVIAIGGSQHGDRQRERNLRFDTPERSLSSQKVVLRLRTDDRTRVTLKRPLDQPEERLEIEFQADSAERAQALFTELGFEVVTVYEKVRQTFKLGQAEIVIDELPFGNFTEIEAPTLAEVQTVAQQLGLNWDHRIRLNYLEIFARLRQQLNLPFNEATFANFSKIEIQPTMMQAILT